MTIAEFLRARVDEDERRTRAFLRTLAEQQARQDDPPSGEPTPRQLAVWEAKRQIVTAYQGAMIARQQRPDDQLNAGYLLGITRAVYELARVYADHPDYRQEWRP